MFKRKRVRKYVSDRAGIFDRIFGESLLVDGLEFNFVETGRQTRL